MARDLETLKNILWEQFEAAVKRQPSYEDSNYSGSSTPFNPSIEGRKSLALLASAITGIEAEQREQAADGDSISLPGKAASPLKRG